jgi:hypothetical protein
MTYFLEMIRSNLGQNTDYHIFLCFPTSLGNFRGYYFTIGQDRFLRHPSQLIVH